MISCSAEQTEKARPGTAPKGRAGSEALVLPFLQDADPLLMVVQALVLSVVVGPEAPVALLAVGGLLGQLLLDPLHHHGKLGDGLGEGHDGLDDGRAQLHQGDEHPNDGRRTPFFPKKGAGKKGQRGGLPLWTPPKGAARAASPPGC